MKLLWATATLLPVKTGTCGTLVEQFKQFWTAALLESKGIVGSIWPLDCITLYTPVEG